MVFFFHRLLCRLAHLFQLRLTRLVLTKVTSVSFQRGNAFQREPFPEETGGRNRPITDVRSEPTARFDADSNTALNAVRKSRPRRRYRSRTASRLGREGDGWDARREFRVYSISFIARLTSLSRGARFRVPSRRTFALGSARNFPSFLPFFSPSFLLFSRSERERARSERYRRDDAKDETRGENGAVKVSGRDLYYAPRACESVSSNF